MKVIPISLIEHYSEGSTTIAYAILIQRNDGATFGFTSHDEDLILDITSWGFSGQTAFVFDSEQGFNASNIVTTSGLQVDNMEITTLNDGSFFDSKDILKGIWNNAKFRIFRYNWSVANPDIANHVETLMVGTFGNITINRETLRIELRGLTQKLQQSLGIVSTKTCRARLGSTVGPNKCLKDLTDFTYNYTVSTVTDRSTFISNDASIHPNDWFGEGELTFTSGLNTGATQKIRTSQSNGQIQLVLPMIDDIQIGDSFTVIAGCRKRREDCRDKFQNTINFQGEPDRPLTDELLKPVVPNA